MSLTNREPTCCHQEYNRCIMRQRQIQGRAYFLWNEAGRPENAALEYWLQAEREWEEDDAFNHRRMMRWGQH